MEKKIIWGVVILILIVGAGVWLFIKQENSLYNVAQNNAGALPVSTTSQNQTNAYTATTSIAPPSSTTELMTGTTTLAEYKDDQLGFEFNYPNDYTVGSTTATDYPLIQQITFCSESEADCEGQFTLNIESGTPPLGVAAFNNRHVSVLGSDGAIDRVIATSSVIIGDATGEASYVVTDILPGRGKDNMPIEFQYLFVQTYHDNMLFTGAFNIYGKISETVSLHDLIKENSILSTFKFIK